MHSIILIMFLSANGFSFRENKGRMPNKFALACYEKVPYFIVEPHRKKLAAIVGGNIAIHKHTQ